MADKRIKMKSEQNLRYMPPSWLGKKHTEKTKQKLSRALKGNENRLGFKNTEEHNRKLQEANIGRKHTDEAKLMMSRAKTGKPGKRLGCKWTEGAKARVRGLLSHKWKGGISFKPYPVGWTKTLKESIRQRDGYICQLCGKTQEENGRKLSVHHIDYIKEHLDPENLTALCCSCNVKVNFGRKIWMEYFRSKLRLRIIKEA